MSIPDEEQNIAADEAYPPWWKGTNKDRPEVALLKSPNIPGGQMVLIKRHFSEANIVMHGET